METTIVYCGYIGRMEKKMETTEMGYMGYMLGLYWDNGKENRNYYNGLYGVYVGVI